MIREMYIDSQITTIQLDKLLEKSPESFYFVKGYIRCAMDNIENVDNNSINKDDKNIEYKSLR